MDKYNKLIAPPKLTFSAKNKFPDFFLNKKCPAVCDNARIPSTLSVVHVLVL